MNAKQSAAKVAIIERFNANDDENPVRLFVTHHLAEIEPSYWEQHLGTTEPTARQVVDLLTPVQSTNDEESDEEIDVLDFSLPNDVTHYVVCVTFDEDGNVEDVQMES